MSVIHSPPSKSDEDNEYFLIPSLGQHYSRKWALEDLLDEHSEAARLLQENCDSSVWGDDSGMCVCVCVCVWVCECVYYV